MFQSQINSDMTVFLRTVIFSPITVYH